ncbi:BrnT family toxin [Sulfuricurvum sp.]|uniref:BrnT family toxin n=1 Tax=Sulfuricurvum sp. TaxID=2025608 RepID=UPI002631B69D|nr:BrnT family toxin [Sulfuricurvum sp.]MDD4884563.1 BrnT family toxin [Sulfuricurvum sp.]
MIFEYDPEKSSSNLLKHGIDFERAQLLWGDPNALEIQAKSDTESRYARIRKIEEIIWIAFYTYRGDNVRLISVRRTRENEKRIYDES